MKTTYQADITEADVETEDGGMARIVEIDSDDEDARMFVRIQSWADDGVHSEFDRLVGRRVRVTVETLDDEGDGSPERAVAS